MKYLYCLGCLILGVILLVVTIKDEKTRKASWTTEYVMHLKGYLAGFGFIVLGISYLLE